MIAYRSATGRPGEALRPLLDVFLHEDLVAPYRCLVDSGAGGIRMAAGLARGLGIELPAEPTGADVIAGAVRSQTYEIDVPLTTEIDVAMVTWMAPVTFCDPWPHPFGLLGQRGFLDAFDVLFEGRRKTFTLTRAKG